MFLWIFQKAPLLGKTLPQENFKLSTQVVFAHDKSLENSHTQPKDHEK